MKYLLIFVAGFVIMFLPANHMFVVASGVVYFMKTLLLVFSLTLVMLIFVERGV